MKAVTIEELEDILHKSHDAIWYALEYQEELENRTHAYTLYGPPAYLIGACAASSHVTPVRARKLQKSTRRKDYFVYEMDENFQVIRTKQVSNNKTIEIIHHFELNGIRFAFDYYRPHEGFLRAKTARILAYKHEKGKPIFYADAQGRFLFIQYFEHPSPNVMQVSVFRLYPDSAYTPSGLPANPNALIGADDSRVQTRYYEEVPAYIDFAQWFK